MRLGRLQSRAPYDTVAQPGVPDVPWTRNGLVYSCIVQISYILELSQTMQSMAPFYCLALTLSKSPSLQGQHDSIMLSLRANQNLPVWSNKGNEDSYQQLPVHRHFTCYLPCPSTSCIPSTPSSSGIPDTFYAESTRVNPSQPNLMLSTQPYVARLRSYWL